MMISHAPLTVVAGFCAGVYQHADWVPVSVVLVAEDWAVLLAAKLFVHPVGPPAPALVKNHF
jgi:hypothetical protein